MAEDNSIVLANKNLGQIKIAPEVIEIIVGIAARQIDGVYAMKGTLKNSVSALFKRPNQNKGVKLTQEKAGLSVDIFADLNYGVSVPKVALAIQEKVRQQLFFMTGLKLDHVNVHIDAIIPEKQASVDVDHLFDDDNDENENKDGVKS